MWDVGGGMSNGGDRLHSRVVTVTVAPVSPARADPAWRDRLAIGLAYALAWGLLLVNRGLYWDDWTLVGRSAASLVEGFSELGMPWVGYLHAAILAMPLPGLVGHILVFCVYGLSTLVLHAVLLRVPALSRMDALVAALTFALLPVNVARVALINLPYGLSLLAFLAATWLLLRYLEDGGLVRRLAALALFVVSFTTASLLILYVVPLAVAALILWRQVPRAPIPSLVLRYADFIALPVAYWLLKWAFFPASGVYEGYNALTVRGLVGVPQSLISIPWQVLVEPLVRAASAAGIVGPAAGALVAAWLVRRSRAAEPGRFVPAPALALIGVAVLGLGVFAYLAVGRVPTIWDWSSRHQLLVPLGVGLLAAAAARGLRSAAPLGRVVGLAVALLLGIAAVADMRTLVDYQADWYKQTALIEAARTVPEARTARHIRVVDDATELNALRRTYRFYEYNALFSEALGDTRRLVSEAASEPGEDEIAQFIARPAYRMDGYVPSPVDLELRISRGEASGAALDVLRLLVLEAAGSPSFDTEVARLIEVRASPVGSLPVP